MVILHVFFVRWGCTHKQSAVECYTSYATKNHEGLKVTAAGLFIDCERLFGGALPDGIITLCCGKWVLEVKCPFCVKDGLPQEDQENFCMTQKDGKWSLRRDHCYLYQVQAQLSVCKVSYCDFVVWTETGIAVERITVDSTFYETVMEDAKHFFIYGMLPEIIGKWYTRKPLAMVLYHFLLPVHMQQTPLAIRSLEIPMLESEDYSKVWCYL